MLGQDENPVARRGRVYTRSGGVALFDYDIDPDGATTVRFLRDWPDPVRVSPGKYVTFEMTTMNGRVHGRSVTRTLPDADSRARQSECQDKTATEE